MTAVLNVTPKLSIIPNLGHAPQAKTQTNRSLEKIKTRL